MCPINPFTRGWHMDHPQGWWSTATGFPYAMSTTNPTHPMVRLRPKHDSVWQNWSLWHSGHNSQPSSVSLWSRETSTWRNSCTRRSSSVNRHAVRHHTRHTLEEESRTATAHLGKQSTRRRTTQCSGSMDSRRWSSWMESATVLCWLRDLMMMMNLMWSGRF